MQAVNEEIILPDKWEVLRVLYTQSNVQPKFQIRAVVLQLQFFRAEIDPGQRVISIFNKTKMQIVENYDKVLYSLDVPDKIYEFYLDNGFIFAIGSNRIFILSTSGLKLTLLQTLKSLDFSTVREKRTIQFPQYSSNRLTTYEEFKHTKDITSFTFVGTSNNINPVDLNLTEKRNNINKFLYAFVLVGETQHLVQFVLNKGKIVFSKYINVFDNLFVKDSKLEGRINYLFTDDGLIFLYCDSQMSCIACYDITTKKKKEVQLEPLPKDSAVSSIFVKVSSNQWVCSLSDSNFTLWTLDRDFDVRTNENKSLFKVMQTQIEFIENANPHNFLFLEETVDLDSYSIFRIDNKVIKLTFQDTVYENEPCMVANGKTEIELDLERSDINYNDRDD
jgi:WD40 repeat protein